jgi:hypothetical protein
MPTSNTIAAEQRPKIKAAPKAAVEAMGVWIKDDI